MKFDNIIEFLVVFLVLVLASCGFLAQNESNYLKLKAIDLETVNHPENLPTKEFAKLSSFGFENIKSDILWLETIQYIGGNAISSAYKKYLFAMIDLITELNPYFEKPYKIGMLLLPDYNPRYEKITEDEKLNYIKQAEIIGLKGIENFCDKYKIELIKKEDDLDKVESLEKYKNPCSGYQIPYFLAYIYYFHLNNPRVASDYYKIALANTDSVSGAKILAAIMRGKGGDREKAFLMFLNIGKSFDSSEEQVCKTYADSLQSVGFSIFRKGNLNSSVIKNINDSREKVFGKFNPETEHDVKMDNECSNYINKSIREINLHYIEVANENYKKDNSGVSAINAKILYDEKYINYLPIDFQQYEDYGIIYEYNKDTGNFDYEMGSY